MNRGLFFAAAAAAALACASIFWFLAAQATPQHPATGAVDRGRPAPVTAATPPSLVHGVTLADRDSAGAREAVPADWTELSRRMDAMGDRLATREFRAEADRLLGRWMTLDREAALAWLEGHRGDARFDRLVASAAQMLIAGSDFPRAQKLADQVVTPETRAWLHEEVWAIAFERRLVSAEELQGAGLTPEALRAIASGGRRD